MNQKIIIIAGPTAVGKSALAVEAAKKFNGEVISVDSMQIYRGLDIGTGKITAAETEGITHHLLDIKNPDEPYSVSEFVADCKACIKKIAKANKLPILAGGTGLYFNALLNNYNFGDSPKSDEIRLELQQKAEMYGNNHLFAELSKIDPESAKKISLNDTRRIIRTLEIFYTTGVKKSVQIEQNQNSEFDCLFFVLSDEREKLYEKINFRVEKMFASGLIDEVLSLIKYENCQSMQAIGYKEIVDFLETEGKLVDVIDKVKQNSRHYAKRQLTYFRWMKANKNWILHNEKDTILPKIASFLP